MAQTSIWQLHAANQLSRHGIDDPLQEGGKVLRLKQARYVLGQHLHIERSLQPLVLRELIDAGLVERLGKQRIRVRTLTRGS